MRRAVAEAANDRARRTAGRVGTSRNVPGGFFERVHTVVRRIPRGRVATYGQVAALLGTPRAGRTVGWALRAVPDGTDIPWHRVLGAGGRIRTVAKDPGGSRQARLLRGESVAVRLDGSVSLARYGWRAR